MRVVIQRVQRCSVEVGGNVIGEIGKGLAILLGVEETDTQEDIDWLCGKISRLRIFDDENGVMNLDIQQAG
ncbi:MAG: D-aminoacyl-tRNA deacylase, partial [Alistipes sp.]|nr:D-aminoacyl-tRNA deacylase [Alistipes sp.]